VRVPCLNTALAQGARAREVRLRPSALTPSALRALAAFMYTDRLDAPIEDAEVLVRAVRAAPCRAHRTARVAAAGARGEAPRALLLRREGAAAGIWSLRSSTVCV
jgi:hypothetical protein